MSSERDIEQAAGALGLWGSGSGYQIKFNSWGAARPTHEKSIYLFYAKLKSADCKLVVMVTLILPSNVIALQLTRSDRDSRLGCRLLEISSYFKK